MAKINQLSKLIAKNKYAVIAVAVAITLVAVPAYNHDKKVDEQRSAEQQQLIDEKLAEAEKSEKEAELAKKQKLAEAKKQKQAEAERLAQEAEKKQQEQAQVATAPVYEAETPKPEAETKTEDKPSYQEVSLSLRKSGNTVVGTIGSNKSGTCYFTWKDYTDTKNPKYTTSESSAQNGSCSTNIPSGSWTHVKASFKASDYSAKGYSTKLAL